MHFSYVKVKAQFMHTKDVALDGKAGEKIAFCGIAADFRCL